MRSELAISELNLQCKSTYNASLTYAVSLSSLIRVNSYRRLERLITEQCAINIDG